MGNYFESEDEKLKLYLKRKLLQWRDNAKNSSKENLRNRVARWIEQKYKTGIARENWRTLAGKYDMYVNNSLLFQVKQRLRNWLKLRDMAEKLRNRFKKSGVDQLKEGVEFKKILILMKSLFTNWEERNKFLAKRFFVRKWYMQVKRSKQREDTLDKAMKEVDKKLLSNTVTTLADVCQAKRLTKAVPVARAVDFFTNLRKKRRILGIMGNYFESEDEKLKLYLKRKLLQWRDNAKNTTKEGLKRRVARWTEQKYKIANARDGWRTLAGKYDMFVNNSLLFQVKSRLRNWLKLRAMAEKLRIRFKKAGADQLKEGVEFKKILMLMRSLFLNWEERNKFLAKRFFVRKWFMQVKRSRQRDDALDKAMKEIDKKSLTNTVTILGDVCQTKRLTKAVPVARAVDFFTNLRKIWGDWDKIKRRSKR